MEVTGYPPYIRSERLKVREQVRRETPSCKIVLLVDENSGAELAKQAKKDGLIDQFIYGSVSSAYLTALMDTL